jgi:hypothetical protein
MPSGKHWTIFIFINVLFITYIAFVFYFSSLQEIKDNWPDYRCNPMYMPLSDNIEQDFVFCMQNMQTSYMGYLLQPITFVTSYIGDILSTAVGEINDIRAMFDKVRTFISSIIQSVFGVFLNLVIEFQRITISIKDLIGKTIGVMVTLMYMVDGSIKTMNSTWNGPPGQMVQALGKCFDPHTILFLQNGKRKEMHEIELGEILIDGSIVETTMKIQNTLQEPFYEIISKDNKEEKKKEGIASILVTGSHLIQDHQSNSFCLVKEFAGAKKTSIISPYFCCLITNTHRIPIYEYVFWDWEDHFHEAKTKTK